LWSNTVPTAILGASKPGLILIAMLHAQFSGARGLCEIEANLKSHASKLYHLGGDEVSKSALSDANRLRPFEIFAGLLSILMLQLQAGYRRKIGDCVRLIDSTSVKLSSLSGKWATFRQGFAAPRRTSSTIPMPTSRSILW
jgi:hypothetical protein